MGSRGLRTGNDMAHLPHCALVPPGVLYKVMLKAGLIRATWGERCNLKVALSTNLERLRRGWMD